MTSPPDSGRANIEARAAAQAFDLFALPADYIDAPWRYHRLLRDFDPIHANADGSVLLTRYADVRTVWRDVSASVDKTEMFRAKFGEGPLLEHHTTAMLFRDPPDHDRLRAVVNPFFAPKQIARFRLFIEQLVDGLLDEVQERGSFDFVRDFASRIPIALITRIMGVPPEDGEHLRALGLRVLFPLNPRVPAEAIASGHEAAAEFAAYLAEHVEHARSRRGAGEPESVLEALVASEGDGDDRVSESEIVQMCLLVLNGGHETTTNLMAVGMNGLLDHPDQLRLLRDEPESLGATFVEELIRYVSPLQLQGRRLTRDLELPSGDLRAGTEVVLCQASANRDERVFSDPDRLDLRRMPNGHVAFGLGVHVCIGRPLARLETSIAMPKVARRLAGIERTGDPVFSPNVRFRGLTSLPVAVRR